MINVVETQKEFMCEITKKLEDLKVFVMGDVVEKTSCSCEERKAPNCLLDDMRLNSERLDYILELTNIISEAIQGGKR